MAKLLYSVSMSLDGFIAGAGGDMSWLTPFVSPGAEPDPVADELLASIGALLTGGRTYRGQDPNQGTDSEGAFGGEYRGPEVVLTSHPAPAGLPPGVTFFSDLDDAVTAAKRAAGDTYVNVLGATVAKSCLEAGALDEILVFVVPVMLGDGVRLFDHPGGTQVRLERIGTAAGPVETMMRFRVAR